MGSPELRRPARQAGGRDPREVEGRWKRFQRHWFGEPPAALAHAVSYFWAVHWDYGDQPPYRQLIVPYPNVHLSFVAGETARVNGVSRRHVVRVLEGAGRVFGVAFRPGGFRPFLGRAVSSLTDRSVPAAEVFGPAVPEREMAEVTSWPEAVELVEPLLRTGATDWDPAADEAASMVACIAEDPDLTRVDELAARFGLGVRRLQRSFAEYVGVGPKWVIRRYRLHEVTQHMERGLPIEWARLAADLGYSDQAHLSRDFTAMVGETPTAYAERYPPRTGSLPG